MAPRQSPALVLSATTDTDLLETAQVSFSVWKHLAQFAFADCIVRQPHIQTTQTTYPQRLDSGWWNSQGSYSNYAGDPEPREGTHQLLASISAETDGFTIRLNIMIRGQGEKYGDEKWWFWEGT